MKGNIYKSSLYFISILIFVVLSFHIGYAEEISTPTPTASTTPTPTPSPSQPANNNSEKVQEIEKKIIELENKVSEAKKQEKTLSSQIDAMDNQIKLTELRMESTKSQIFALTEDITLTEKKIGNLEESLKKLTEATYNRIIATYQMGSTDPIELLADVGNASGFFTKINYLRLVQAHDKQVLLEVAQSKNDYTNQKNILEEKKKKVESLNQQLEQYTVQLAHEKEEKDELLKVTQNDEKKFQQELARLKADKAAILGAISNIGAKIGNVNRGDVIATQGNTGCVYPRPPGGHHLHFEVYKDAKVENNQVVDINTGEPIQFKFTSHLVNPRQYLDSGQLGKPIAVYPGGVTAEFSASGGDYIPALGEHTGIDIAGPIGSAIYAAEKGIAYATGGSTCDAVMGYPPGTTYPARGRIIDHQNGLVTLYWHTTD